MVLVETMDDGAEQVFVRSTAALRIAAYLGGWWRWLTLGYVLPGFLRDWLYDAFARALPAVRQYETCLVPSPDIRARFLEVSP
ncbi:DCC1-like thiol-disulfide oxidoreductase family protein [Chloracidobacterium aggregatum]|uniref:DCC1-like thiol-disulfide oxidoreductase family protein n=1 Tax=Chloracidobacterium aggregatum TaxID=2851959 RepID=UPI002016F045|nr:DCC1-like thiol-disulfide oxidoreductase family protein [Chloracidobacterium aggregatum]